ncbi:hypothetical protein SAMN04490248_13417 [Salinihabitans flavidus]|uniref:Uncharacterized protein n=1 Tax=Salinihabitans flavidus TaxID=569882 RepID=A0A1H8VTY6_9RHOB|nr:hypothetical protein [Salinihabitans flavidus]SEP18892.1 hypothetical protein SAMN04490248_13417 [Salinihabitans flavidus]
MGSAGAVRRPGLAAISKHLHHERRQHDTGFSNETLADCAPELIDGFDRVGDRAEFFNSLIQLQHVNTLSA